MENSLFAKRLALLPQFDTEKRTAAHVQGQKSYSKLYVSEGRAYMSSWCQNDGTHSGEESKPVDIDIGTPILKPRVTKSVESSKADGVKPTTKTVITVESSNLDEKDKKTRSGTEGKKRQDARKKAEKSKEKLVSPAKKKRVAEESPSEGSSRAERLRERRERKRKKKAIVEPQTSDKENEKSEGRQTRTRNKKMPAGFALMHGFAATNVGKDRLTIKPRLNIGVFSKGKASAKTKTVKTKASGKKDFHTDGYFSESKFLNKSKRMIVPLDRSSTSDASSPTSFRGAEERASPKRAEKVTKAKTITRGAPDKEIVATSSPAKNSKASSIVWDIELGKPLCTDDGSTSDTPKKRGSVVLDTSRHVWAKAVCEGDTEKKDATAQPQEGNEVPSSIGPSQSASQRIIKVSPAKPTPETRSKYFQTRDPPLKEVQDKAATEPLVSLCSFNESSVDMVQGAMIEDRAENMTSLDNGFIQSGDRDRVPELVQKEFGYDDEKCQPYVEDDDLGDSAEYQDLQMGDGIFFQPEYSEEPPIDNNDEARGQVLDEYTSLRDDVELDGYPPEGDAYYDHFDDAADQGDLEMDELYDYTQGENMPENDAIYDSEESVVLDHVQVASINGTDDDSDGELDGLQTEPFSQGRALLLGCSTHGKKETTSSYLTSAELDVVKRLRDHWLPQKL